VHDQSGSLVAREHQSVSNHDILATGHCEDNHLSDILGYEGLNTLVNSIGFALVTTETDD
jgi:hypothetical protein